MQHSSMIQVDSGVKPITARFINVMSQQQLQITTRISEQDSKISRYRPSSVCGILLGAVFRSPSIKRAEQGCWRDHITQLPAVPH